MLKQAVNTCKYENDALILAIAAKIIRDDMQISMVLILMAIFLQIANKTLFQLI